VNWTRGSGDAVIVVMKLGSPVDAAPTDGTEYTPTSEFGVGVTTGPGNYVVYTGALAQVDISGLSESSTYHVAVYELAGSGVGTSGINYQQTAPLEGSRQTDPVPLGPVLSATSVAGVGATSATLGATVDADNGFPILARGTVWNTTGTPVTENLLAEGTAATGLFTHVRSPLPAGTRIYARGYATNASDITYSAESSFYTEPATQASAVSFTNVTGSAMRVAWTRGSGDAVLVVMRQDDAVTTAPTDGTEYTPSASFGSGQTTAVGDYVVYTGALSQVDMAGLSEDTTYHVAVYELAGSGAGASGINYIQIAPAIGNDTTPSTPGGVPELSVSTFSAVGATTATLGAVILTDGGEAITNRGTVWNTTGPPIAQNALLESGTTTGAFAHVRSGLPAASQIFCRGYALNVSGTGYADDTSFYTEPDADPTSLTFADITFRSMRLNWTPVPGLDSIVLAHKGAAVDGVPLDGIVYADSTSLGIGDQIGTGNFVIYKGAASQVVMSSLTATNTYHISIFAYAGSTYGATGINYRVSGSLTGSQMTASFLPGHNSSYGIQCADCHSHSGAGYFVPSGTNQQSLCESCHNPSGQASTMTNVALHVVNGTTVVDCGMCHEVHNNPGDITSYNAHTLTTTQNMAFIRADVSKYVPGGLTNAVFQSTNDYAYAAASSPWNGVCQACHTNTVRHTNDNSSDNDHHIGENCMTCHSHAGGFAPVGDVGDKSCLDAGCHGGTALARRHITPEFDLISRHANGAAVTDEDCAVCHYEAVEPTAHINGKIDLRDPDSGNPITGFTAFSRANDDDFSDEPWIANVQNNFCLKCHDADGASSTNVWATGGSARQPFASNTKDALDVASQLSLANEFYHPMVGIATGNNTECNPTTMVAPWNQDSTSDHDQISCFDCHGANGHGGANQRMLRNAVDFDAIAPITAETGLPAGAGIAIETLCSRCHNSAVYVTATVTASKFEYHGQDQSQHRAGDPTGGNELGCMGCHAGTASIGDAPKGGGANYANGAGPGNIHGGSYDWSSTTSFAAGPTDVFMLGGFIGGWQINGSNGECSGGGCNHGGVSRSGKSYTLAVD
jgi:hypothetical protein